jgi:site-specific DNA recombinase
MSSPQVAIYARVSSDHQAEAQTVVSQVAALRERIAAEGLALPDALQFIDEGYSGTTLIRPALERLRDVIAARAVDRLYIHSPDRLARKYAYQVLLVDEFRRAGVEVIFLNRALGQSPEDDLLLQVQGMIAEYERAKIIERPRRGKRHAAQAGVVNVLSGAPYGYRYVAKYAGGGRARYEIVPDEARLVRQVFAWVGRDRQTIGEVCRRLTRAGEVTRTGKTVWDRSMVWGMLKNPAYIGTAAFGKTRQEPLRPRLRAQRGRPLQPRRAVSTVDMPPADWFSIPVPALVEPRYLPQSRRNCRRIAAMRGNPSVAPSICSKAWCSVSTGAMPTMGNASAPVPAKGSRGHTPTTAASGRRRIALAGSGSVRIPKCGPICSMWRCGARSRRCSPTPSVSLKNIGVGCRQNRPPSTLRVRRWKPTSGSCARGSHGSLTVMRTALLTSRSLSPASSVCGAVSPRRKSSANSSSMQTPSDRIADDYWTSGRLRSAGAHRLSGGRLGTQTRLNPRPGQASGSGPG